MSLSSCVLLLTLPWAPGRMIRGLNCSWNLAEEFDISTKVEWRNSHNPRVSDALCGVITS
jgi:hypothetical protein